MPPTIVLMFKLSELGGGGGGNDYFWVLGELRPKFYLYSP